MISLFPDSRLGSVARFTVSLDRVVEPTKLLVYLALAAFVFARPLDAWLASFPTLSGPQSMLRLLAMFGIVTGIHILVSLPLSFIEGFVVESTYNWYWLVDGLMEAGYQVHLANPAAIQQYSGLKYTNDHSDARWLAHLLRLGVLP